MFETSPFCDCPLCGTSSVFGVLHIGGNRLRQRCQKCRHSEDTALPELDKKVIYLDQFAISNVYKIRAGETLKPPHVHDFWIDFDRRITRAQMAQTAIFPASDIHGDETIVSEFSSELRIAHEMFGGDTSFKGSSSLLFDQESAYAESFIMGHDAPDFKFDVDDALEGHRNAWLPHLHITVTSDYSSFADGLVERRDRLHAVMLPLFQKWQTEKPTFEAALKNEIAGDGEARIRSLVMLMQEYATAVDQEDAEKFFDISVSDNMRRLNAMFRIFKHHGIPEEDCFHKILQFWFWPALQNLPYHKISSYLFAITAARLAGGQKKLPTRGFSNDIKAITTYAPYADAMFVDLECENLLNDSRLKKALTYKARIFSKATSKHFYDYLDVLENGLSADVKRWAHFLYQIPFPQLC